MAKITKARRKEPAAGSALNAQIRAAKGKATRELRRHAEANKIKLAVADKNRELFPNS